MILTPLLAMAAASAPVAAEPVPAEPVSASAPETEIADYKLNLESCIDQSDQTNYAYSQCFAEAIDAAENIMDRKMYAIFEIVANDEAVAESFKQEQSAWRDFREQACDLYWQQPYFGSMHRSIIGPDCVLGVIEGRIVQLDSILDNMNGE